jgi:hypothetical protein
LTLASLIDLLKANNVRRYVSDGLELEFGDALPAHPMREVEDFATPGYMSAEDEDGRFDHVAMRPRRTEDA